MTVRTSRSSRRPAAGHRRAAAGWRPLARHFWRDDSGTPAIEFAFVLPILVMMLLLSVEITNALQTVRRGTAAATVIADLVSREIEIPPDGSPTIAAYVNELDQVADELFTPFNVPISFSVAHVYYNDDGYYQLTNASTWQYTHNSPDSCDGESIDISNFTSNDQVHEVAPEFRQVNSNNGTPADPTDDYTVRDSLTSEDGAVVVVRLTYCYEALLFGVLEDIVGPRQVVATYAPRNTRCIPAEGALAGDGSSTSDCSAMESFAEPSS
ncbi:MAG: pilus assembly protein [Rhodospirillaceae bacterium]|nr:pilus assembly protein [Rhodospirillaceae bacterium]